MLFVTLLSRKPTATMAQVLQQRMAWTTPEGMKPIAEYWLQSNNPSVIAISEADNIAPIMAATMPWTDMFDITVIPAVSAEEGLKLVSQMMPKT